MKVDQKIIDVQELSAYINEIGYEWVLKIIPLGGTQILVLSEQKPDTFYNNSSSGGDFECPF